MGVKQGKKQGKSVLDRENRMCKIPEARELMVPGGTKRRPEELVSREVGRVLILKVL